MTLSVNPAKQTSLGPFGHTPQGLLKRSWAEGEAGLYLDSQARRDHKLRAARSSKSLGESRPLRSFPPLTREVQGAKQFPPPPLTPQSAFRQRRQGPG